MKKLSLVLVALLIGAVSFSQKIKVTCHDTQTLIKSGHYEDPDIILNSPDYKTTVTPADCDYIFNLQEKTLKFVSRSNPRSFERDINVEFKGNGKYVITYDDSGVNDMNFNTFSVRIKLDTKNKTFEYLYYNTIIDETSVYPTGNITMTIIPNV